MAQDFSYRYPLVDAQGKFGSMDGDMQQQCVILKGVRPKIMTSGTVTDINKDTIDFIDNYDEWKESRQSYLLDSPNLLANGASGIAVWQRIFHHIT